MKALNFVWLAVAVSIVISGCSKPAPTRPAPQAQQKRQDIEWFTGTLDAALAKAGAENKPVFLYWGAEWCPYCKDLRANVFTRPDFIEKSRLFVPVYLDGDTAGAQKLGDEFHISGYPTVIVLRSDRKELARIGGGMDRGQYAGVLDLVLGDTKPVSELLASLDSGAAPLSKDDCRRLAYNAWALDDDSTQDPSRFAASLGKAIDRCPADSGVERARLTIIAASATADAGAGKPVSARMRDLAQKVDDVLADRSLAVSMADAWQYLGDKFFAAVKKSMPDKVAEVSERWNATIDAIAADPRYTAGDQLSSVASKLVAAQAFDPKGQIPPALAEDAKHRVDTAVAGKYDEYTRAGMVNAALGILDTLGDRDRAFEVAQAEMKTSQTPYYYMSDLGSIEEARGNKEAALGWFEKAYSESKGAATRVQWGTSYVNALIRMAPQDETRIEKAALDVLAELDGPDSLHSRTRTRLAKMEKSLQTWNGRGDHMAALAAIRQKMTAVCGGVATTDRAHATCAKFLAKA